MGILILDRLGILILDQLDWATIDLGSTFVIRRIRVNPFGNSAVGYYYADIWNVRYATAEQPNVWLDFSNPVKTLGAGTMGSPGISIFDGDPGTGSSDPAYQFYEFMVDPTTLRYLRVEITKGDVDGDSDLDEVEIYEC